MSSGDLNDGINSEDKNPQKQQKRHAQQQEHTHQFRLQNSGMTPSIITTINNTSPTLPANYSNHNNNNHNVTRAKKNSEPHESYIEDSFVGHWEHEDEDEYLGEYPDESIQNRDQEDDSALQHPSTIEFDFDSFGPESFIYTPPSSSSAPSTTTTTARATQAITNNTATAIQAPVTLPALDEVSPELESQQEEQSTATDRAPNAQQATSSRIGLTQQVNSTTLDYLVDTAQIDYKVIEPYKKVISHAGYCHHFDSSATPHNPDEQAPAVIVFSACYLPDRSRRDYDYVMDHLFLYVLSSLHELIADDYILIYLHNTQPSTQTNSRSASANDSSSSSTSTDRNQRQNNLPTFNWMKRCYQMIDRKLRKNLKILYLVKPTFWLKTIVIMCRPFISAKFSRKLRFVENMDGLKKCLPVDKLTLPASAENI